MRISIFRLAILVLPLSTNVARASEVCNHWLSGPLHQQSQGLDRIGSIDASVVWLPPTGGEYLVVGGDFTTIGGMPISNIAMWDGASWRGLGSGVNGFVHSLAVYNGHLIAGGRFTQAGGAPASLIARFDGASWHPLADGLVHTTTTSAAACYALTTFGGDLIAGGHFNRSGNTVLVNLGRWNGSAWSVVGDIGTQGSSHYVKALRVHNNALHIGGQFNTAQGPNQAAVFADNIVQLANGVYAALASGTQGPVETLHSFGADLIAGGSFTQAGGLSANRVARWIPGGEFGGAWGTLGSGLASTVIALQPFNGLLIAGGLFPGGVRAWNGSSWVGLGAGLSGVPSLAADLNVFNGQLIAGGNFDSAGGATATGIAQWSGSAWSALQSPIPQVLAMEQLGSRFIAAGSFLQSTTNQTPAHNIIGWNGSTLTRVQSGTCCGEGTNGTIRALKGISGFGNQLIVGGDFTVAGGVTANRIARYDEPGLLPATWTAMGNGFNNSVHAIERYNNSTHAAGTFTQSGVLELNRIARWDGTNWAALSFGLNGPVYAMKVFNGFLYAGGEFTAAAGLSTGCLARWNGSVWSTYSGLVGNILAGSVTALEVHNNKLYIGNTLGSGFHVLEYSGTSTTLVGTANGIISSLKSDGQHLYVLGGFTTIAGINANRVARWNSTQGWSDAEGGTNDVVNTLGLFHGEIHVGLGLAFGFDGFEDVAPQPGKGWVRYSPTGAPWISSNPTPQTVNCGQTATFTVTPAAGFSLLIASWRRNGVALADGATGTGSTISGAHASKLTILNPSSADAGAYDCVFGNICGSATSSAAMLTLNNCCAGDIDNDANVDIDDLVRCVTSWGNCPPLPDDCSADVNGSSAVNIDDLVVVIITWGPCP